MKKFTALLLAAATTALLIGCGATPSTEGSGSGGANSSGADNVIQAEDGLAAGNIGDIMRTYWFDFTVNSAYLCDSFSSYNASDGYNLLVVDLSVKNTFGEELPMFDTDFWVQWDSDDDDAFAWPVEAADSLSSDVLPGEYYLSLNETRKGLLLFEVPNEYTEFAFAYLEINTDEEAGDVFVVYFEPDQR